MGLVFPKAEQRGLWSKQADPSAGAQAPQTDSPGADPLAASLWPTGRGANVRK